ncbi:DinB family protein [Runella zeae]|uniref:DinB family protein n=1 Tax=Runella zeae TaxID=94255 RepID=UPI000415A97A|nr:DinB family protein [Runella zeae]
MSTPQKLEVWLRGPLPNIPALLQPVAHALLQAREEVAALGHDFDNQLLWQRPAGMASVGFHLQHLTGVLDRLFTYARGEALSPVQLQWLAAEGSPQIEADSFERLFQKFSNQIEKALLQLEHTDIAQLTEVRGVGRAQIPSTVIGLLFHAAEHSQRHLGQLLVTAAIVKTQSR